MSRTTNRGQAPGPWDPPPPPRSGWRDVTDAQKRLVGFIAVLAVVNIAYRLIYASGFQQTAALYVGIPALLAMGLALLPPQKSTTGMLFKGSLLALLLACVILPEGLLCLLFVVPLVAAFSAIVGGFVDWSRRRDQRRGPTMFAIGLPLLLLSLEGVVGTPIDPRDHATASTVVDATPEEVAEALAATPTFERGLPAFLTVGFNRPVGATGSGIVVGDQRVIEFDGGTHDDHPGRVFGGTGERSVDHHSQMHLEVVSSTPGRVVFAVEHDLTMLARWADLERAVVTWEAVGADETRVTWRLDFERELFPTAYFGPLQRYGMGEAADYLLGCVIEDRVA